MAKRKDDFSFNFSSRKPPKKEEPPPAEPTAPPDETAEIPVTDSSVDPFAATTETPAETPADADPFATPAETPAETPADPFATPPELAETPVDTPADATPESPPEQESSPAQPTRKEHKQFRILILADFSGRTNRQVLEGSAAIAARKPRAIDADSFDRILAGFKPEIRLPVSESSIIPLTFKALEDFRPDALLQRIAGFQGLLQLRADLKDTKKSKEAAAKVRTLLNIGGAGSAKPSAPAAPADSDFERLLNQPIAPKNAGNASADSLIASLVAGSSVPEADPDQAQLIKFIEDALSAGLRAILRHPAVQAVESAWRSVEFLTSRLNTDEDLKLFVLDISRDELYADLAGAPTPQKSGLYQVLIEQTRAPGVAPFSLVVGDYYFDQSSKDVACLAKIAALMHEAGIPLLAGATAKIAGFPAFDRFPDSGRWQPPSDSALWDKIRAHKLATHLGLTAPRFLLRLPYGPRTDAIDIFPFDEMPGEPQHDGYVWGNGAFAVAYVMGQAFLDEGWGFEPGNDVSDLPCHMALVDGDRAMTPCAEGWLSDRVGDILHNLGLIPLLSVRNAAAVKIAGVHSIAKGGLPLAASWAQA